MNIERGFIIGIQFIVMNLIHIKIYQHVNFIIICHYLEQTLNLFSEIKHFHLYVMRNFVF